MQPNTYPTVLWRDLFPRILADWRQGEHVTVIGPTGVGKTTLLAQILGARTYIVVLVTKVHDDTITGDFRGFDRIKAWPPKHYQNRVLLWPDPVKKRTIRSLSSTAIDMRATKVKQRRVFQDALNEIFGDRNWTIVFDEQHYICKDLKLEDENKMFQHQGRSSGLTVVNGTQRPADVPLITYSGSTHAFIWSNNIDTDFKRLAEIGGMNRRDLEHNMNQLGKHEFIYTNTRSGLIVRSQVER